MLGRSPTVEYFEWDQSFQLYTEEISTIMKPNKRLNSAMAWPETLKLHKTSGARVESMDLQFYRHTQNITELKRTFKATSWTEIISDTCETVLKNYLSLKSEGRRIIKHNST